MTKEEFERLILKNGKDIYSFCYYLTENQEDAEELYQDTMLYAMKHCNRIEKAMNPKSFLLSISIGIYRNTKRKFARRKRITPISDIYEEQNLPVIKEEELPEQKYIKKELYKLVRKEVVALPDKYKLPIYMHYINEMTIEEIASIMHLPKGTIKSRLYKARQIMKEKLGDFYYGK